VAKERYQERSPNGLLCTGDDENSDDPIAFEVTADGITLFSGSTTSESSEASASVTDARGGEAAYAKHVGFGQR
jgi:hypothetical protein